MTITYKMRIRHMTIDDIPSVSKINQQLMPDGEQYDRDTFKLHIELYDLSQVIATNDQIVGYILVQIMDRVEAHITSLAVLPGYRGQKLGQRLMLTALVAAKRRKLQCCSLHVHETNEVAIHIYKKIGFQPIRRKANYYNNGDAGIFMRRLI